MKATRFVLAAALLLSLHSYSQEIRTVKESALTGTWKMEMDIARAVRRETQDEDGLGRAIAKGVSGFIESITDALDIRFTFRKGGDLDIAVDFNSGSSDRKKDREYGKWMINKSGKLVIDGNAGNHVSFDGSDEWVMVNGALHPLEDDGTINREIRLVRIQPSAK